jgi:hypothetical protein
MNFLFFYLIKTFIKNFDLPVCKDCIHFLKPVHSDTYLGKCKLFGTKDIITGQINYEYAEHCRNTDKCSKNGTYLQK